MDVPIDSIQIKDRHRRDLGDIDNLAFSIQQVGLLHPIVITPDYNLIAGQRRIEACKQLGWTEIPVHIVDISEIVQGEFAENTQRKDFTPSEAVAIWQSMESHQGHQRLPSDSDGSEPRARAAKTVRMGTDKLSKAKAIVEAAETHPSVFADLTERMDNTGNVNAAYKELRRRQEKIELKRVAEETTQISDLYQLIEGDFQDVCQQIELDSIDVIITDPPYPREYLNLFGDLAEVAARVLKPGGSLLAMTGQSYLPEVLSLITPHLRYHWMVAYLTPGGQSVQLWQRQVNTFWKPVLWFVKGDYTGDWIGDVAKSGMNDNDKRYHQWGQSESGMLDLIDRFSKPGDLILDPMMGAGTTGVAAIQLNRQFIGIDNDNEKVQIAKGRLVLITKE